jgi:NAD(P)H-hydrate repair Nnr-like enzyme with NAD(P)H-hydrate dehydratase domain
LQGLFEKNGTEIDPALAAAIGVYWHGKSGDLARERIGEYGVKARDLIEALPQVLRSCPGKGEQRI